MLEQDQNQTENEVKKRSRGRPRKVLSPEEILELKNKPKRPRGRPKKVLTPEEEEFLKNKPKRARGRPKKILSPEEEMVLELKKMHPKGRGRPKKQLTPQEEWNFFHAPKKGERGRPRKQEILEAALPSLMVKSEKVVLEKTEERLKPKLSWQDFKKKIASSELEDYVFPTEIENSGPKKVAVKQADELSEYILDLRQGVYLDKNFDEQQDVLEEQFEDDEYAWEKEEQPEVQTDLKNFINFEVPDDAEQEVPEIVLSSLPKKKKKKKDAVKINFVPPEVKQEPLPARKVYDKAQGGLMDTFLVAIGKGLYFVWQVLISPFRLLDFIVDRSLKAVWQLVRLVALGVNKLLAFNWAYLNKLSQILVKRRAVAEVASEQAQRRIYLKPILTFAGLALIIVLPFSAINVYQKAKQLRGNVMGVSLEGAGYLKDGSEGVASQDLGAALSGFSKAQDSFFVARQEMESFGVLSGLASRFVPEVKQGEMLLKTGELASEIGQELSRALAVLNQSSNFKLEDKICSSLPGKGQKCTQIKDFDLTDKISYLKNVLQGIEPEVEQLEQLIQEIEVEDLPTEYSEQILSFKDKAKMLDSGLSEFLSLLDFGYSLLGGDEPKRYLVIFQNSREARATGGFMGSFALVDIDRGNVEAMEIPGGGLYDLKASSLVNVEAPRPLQVFSPAWQIWNANWFPDFKLSAEKISWFYENTTNGSTVDGVISLTQDVISDLLAAVGPIEMAEYEKTLAADNFTREVQMAVELEYDIEENKPKQIIADLAPILLQKLIDVEPLKSLDVVLSLDKALNQEKILFYFNDELTQNQAETLGWAGRMKELEENQDYLSVVHTNISGGKTDEVVKNQVVHQVEVQDDGNLIVTVSLTRRHDGNKNDIFESAHNVDYVRFYVPEGAEFISAKGFNFTPTYLFKYGDLGNLTQDETLATVETDVWWDEASGTRISKELDKIVFGNWLQVSPGDEQMAEIIYRLPFSFKFQDKSNKLKMWLAALKGDNKNYKYSLYVDKQLGMNEVDFSSQISFPAGFEIVKYAADKGLEVDKAEVNFSSDLLQDAYYGVVAEE